ncbi:MAG: alkaline phosphatase D family protein [Pseudomonadota bacterium]|nr:alkaline phosphatase D family protein [Pseudomonadota bacterium]
MFSRRLFLASSGAALWLPKLAAAQGGKRHFTLGVASGSPRPNSVILWTRLAPDPLQGGGMPAGTAQVRYRVCSDEMMRNTLQDGVVETSDAKAHSVHVRIEGLKPGREYFYQFYHGDEESPIGRTRTSSPDDASARIALAYCQHYETGHYAAYRDMAEWLPDCVIHTGDYIYEGGVSPLGVQMRDVGGGERRLFEIVRQHDGDEITSLWDYRNRYALYRSDPHLQAAHACAPWIVAMDDHEVDNNWAAQTPQDPEKQTPLEFQVRKYMAFKAYYEHMPIEQPPILRNMEPALQLYGKYVFGPAQVHLLDTRQFRSDQPCGDGRKPYCDEALDPSRTMLGQSQETWLTRELKRSDAAFNVIATQVWFTSYRYNAPPDGPVTNLDSWDGYPAARERLNSVLANDVSNPVFLTGDWHTAMASTLYEKPFDPTSRRLGHELVGGPISSYCPWARDMEVMRDANPHVSYLNGRKQGYLRATFTRDTCRGEFRVAEDSGRPDSPVFTDTDIRTADL